MEDEDFEDLFGGDELIAGSSQDSLTVAAAGLDFCDSDDDEPKDDGQTSVATSISTHLASPAVASESDDNGCQHLYRAGYSGSREVEAFNTPSPGISLRAESKLASSAHGCSKSALKEVRLGYQSDTECSPPFDDDSGNDKIGVEVPEQQTSSASLAVIDKIEAIFEQITVDVADEQSEISIMLKVRSSQIHKPKAPAREDVDQVKTRRICFPGRTAEEAWRFTVVIRILEIMHEALRTGVTVSKRDIYYRDPALFGSQTHVDRYVDDIAYTFSVPRSALNVTAVAKGVIVGALTFCRRDGSTANAASDREGMLVPNLKDILSLDMKSVRWILVVEKEASFRSIATSPTFWNRLSADGVLITGKGYPDIATRALLRFLSMPSPQNGFASPPVYGLVDFDPDGLAILSTYKYGSLALAHESAKLRVPEIKWLGLRSKHIMLAQGNTHGMQGLLTLSARDRNKARNMIGRSVCDEQGKGDSEEWRRELQVMLMLNVKAELQLLDAVPGGMNDLLQKRLRQV